MKLRSATKKPEQTCSNCQMLQPVFINRRTPMRPNKKPTTQSPVFNIHIHVTPKSEELNFSTSAQPIIHLHFDEVAKTLAESTSPTTFKKILQLNPESGNFTLGSINELDSTTNGSEQIANETENRDSENEISDSLEERSFFCSKKKKLDSSNQEHSSEIRQKGVKSSNYTDINSNQSCENERHQTVANSTKQSSEILHNFSETISGNKNDIKLKKAIVLLKDIKHIIKNHNDNTIDTITVSSERKENVDKFLEPLQLLPSLTNSVKGTSKKLLPIVKETSQPLLSPKKKNCEISSKVYQSDDESKQKISDLTSKYNFSEILQKLQDENLRKAIQNYAYKNISDNANEWDCPIEKKKSRKRKSQKSHESELLESEDLKYSESSKKRRRTFSFGIDSKLKNISSGVDSVAKKKREREVRKSRKALNFGEITEEKRHTKKINLLGLPNTSKNYEDDLTQNEFHEEIIGEKVENNTENIKLSDLELNKYEEVQNKIDSAELKSNVKKNTILEKSINCSKEEEIETRDCRPSKLKAKKIEKVKKSKERLEKSTCTVEKMQEIEKFMNKLKESLRKYEKIAEEHEIEFEEEERLANESVKEDSEVLRIKSKKKEKKSSKRKKNERGEYQDSKEKLKRQNQDEKQSEIPSTISNLTPSLQVQKKKLQSDCKNTQKGKTSISREGETCFDAKDVDLIPEESGETNFKNNSPVSLTNGKLRVENNDEVFFNNTVEESYINEIEKITEINFNEIENEEAIVKTDTEGECYFNEQKKKKWTRKRSEASSVTTIDDDVATEIFELSNNWDSNSKRLHDAENEDDNSATIEFRESDLEDFTGEEVKKAIERLDLTMNDNSDNPEERPAVNKLSCSPNTERLELLIEKPLVEKNLKKNSLSKKMSAWARQPLMSDDSDDCDTTREPENVAISATTSHDSNDSEVTSEPIFKAVKKKELKESNICMQLTSSDSEDEHLKKNWKMKEILNKGEQKCEVIPKKVNPELSASKSNTTIENSDFNHHMDLTSNGIKSEDGTKTPKLKFTERPKKLKKKSKKKCSSCLPSAENDDEENELQTCEMQKCKSLLTPKKTVEGGMNGNISQSDFELLFSEIEELNFAKETVGEVQFNVEADLVNDTPKVLEKTQQSNNVCLRIRESCENKNENSTNKNKNCKEDDDDESQVELLKNTRMKKKIKNTNEESQSKERSREFDSDQEIPIIIWSEKKCEKNKINSNKTPVKMVNELGTDKDRNVSIFEKNNSEIFSESKESTFQRENSEADKRNKISGVSDSELKEKKKKKNKKVRKNLNESFNIINDVEYFFDVKPKKKVLVCSGNSILEPITMSDLNVRSMELCEKTVENVVDKTKDILKSIKMTETPKKVLRTPEKLQTEVISSLINNDEETTQTDVLSSTLETPKSSKKRKKNTTRMKLDFKSSSGNEKKIKLLEESVNVNTKLDLDQLEESKNTKKVKKKKKKKEEKMKAEFDGEGSSPLGKAKQTFMKVLELNDLNKSKQSESLDDSRISKPHLNSSVLDLLKSPDGRFTWSQINKACDEISEFELVCEKVSKIQQNLSPSDKCETSLNRNLTPEVQFNCIKKEMIRGNFKEKFKKNKSKVKKKKPKEQKEKFKGKASKNIKSSKKIKTGAKIQQDKKLSSPDYIPLDSSGSTQFTVAPLNDMASHNSHNAMDFKKRMLFGDRVNRFKSNSTLRTLKIKQEIKNTKKF